jgi:hypothetical protein
MLIPTIPVLADSNETGIFGRTHIRAIGSFSICEDEQVLYGHIFVGFIGIKPVFNIDIEICEDSIKRIVMGGISTTPGLYFYLNCIIKE